jgi:hypothetical protein
MSITLSRSEAAAGFEIRDGSRRVGAASFMKKGLHVFAALEPQAHCAGMKDRAHGLAGMAKDSAQR